MRIYQRDFLQELEKVLDNNNLQQLLATATNSKSQNNFQPIFFNIQTVRLSLKLPGHSIILMETTPSLISYEKQKKKKQLTNKITVFPVTTQLLITLPIIVINIPMKALFLMMKVKD